MEQNTSSAFESFELSLSTSGKGSLKAAGGWGIFLAVVGFLFSGLCLMIALSLSFIPGLTDAILGQPGFNMFWIAVVYWCVAFAYLLPSIFLMMFSVRIRAAISSNDTEKLTASFATLKRLFLSLGVMVIAGIFFYMIFVIVITVTTSTGSSLLNY